MILGVLRWYGMVWYGMVWYGMVWYGMVWYGMVQPKQLRSQLHCPFSNLSSKAFDSPVY